MLYYEECYIMKNVILSQTSCYDDWVMNQFNYI